MFQKLFKRIVNKMNDMRPKQLLFLAAIAAFLMFVTIYVGLSLVSKQEVVVKEAPPPPPKTVQTVSVVVAKVNIPPRTRIQDTMLQMKEIPVDIAPEGAIKSFDDVKDVQVKASIFAGDILTTHKVFSATADDGFAGSIPPNCRAVSIGVNDTTSVAGFAKPGDRVDLILVERGSNSVTSNILLQNVPLLSINQDAGGGSSVPEGSNGLPVHQAITNPSIATFALPPEDALKLIAASKLGEIYMSLRPSNPQENYVGEMEYTIESVNSPRRGTVSGSNVPAIPSGNVPLPQIPAVPPTPKIEIIQGDQIVQSSVTPPVGIGNSSASNLPAIPSNGAAPAVTAPSIPSPPLVRDGVVGNTTP